MKSKLFYNLGKPARATNMRRVVSLLAVAACVTIAAMPASADNAPPWMHALVNAPLPEHDEKTNAVLLYEEKNVNVISSDKIKKTVRRAYKILRPEGRYYGEVLVNFRSPGEKINSIHAWCIPAQGKDFEVKDKDAIEGSYPKVEGAELMSDVRVKFLRIPAPDPGNIVGYEYEKEEQPLVLEDEWTLQEESPTRETHYSLQLPTGWEYKATWLNHSEAQPAQVGANQWQWTVSNLKGIREEEEMPPIDGIVARMMVLFFPSGGPGSKGFSDWQQMGTWYLNLTNGRRDTSPALKQKVAELTAARPALLDKMRALASFVQNDIRYVSIQLGIGGWQPHSAADVFGHKYGDCKDKATLLSSMLHEIGVDSYYVVINMERGAVVPEMPAHTGGFNHVMLAIKLNDGPTDPSLIATMQHPKLGKLLFFNPTDEVTPFGQIKGHLQANYGLLVTPERSELVELPQQPSVMNSIHRTAQLTLDSSGRLKGDVQETRVGDRAWNGRWALRTVTNDKDRIKPIENFLAGSLSNYVITKAIVQNLTQTDQPFGFRYSFEAQNYAKNAGDLLLVRPRVLGVKTSGILETKEPRQFPVEFEGPVSDTDTFEITVPEGYVVDDLPPPVDAEFSFASYHSKTEAKGNVIAYTRTFEVKELSVPVSKAEELKKFYRIIASDERNTAVLKASK